MSNEIKSLFIGKIAIATNDYNTVASHIGRCNAFVIYEINGEKIINTEVRENNFTHHQINGEKFHHHSRGEGHHSHDGLINGLKDCIYIISRSGGWRLVEDLKQYNITTLFTKEKLIDDVINLFMIGKLENETNQICK